MTLSRNSTTVRDATAMAINLRVRWLELAGFVYLEEYDRVVQDIEVSAGAETDRSILADTAALRAYLQTADQ